VRAERLALVEAEVARRAPAVHRARRAHGRPAPGSTSLSAPVR
jgi:hypothetical protein